MKQSPVSLALILCVGITLHQCANKTEHSLETNKGERGSQEHIRNITSIVDDDYLRKADDKPDDWLSYGKNYAEDRFSALDQINKDNVKNLGLAWSLNLETTRGIEATPLVADGIMFLSGPWSKVYAVNAQSGKLIWSYDPEVPGSYAEKACCDVVNRGLALYKGRIYAGTLDGRLISLDASTGKELWEVLTVDTTQSYTITGAPRIVKGKVIIGNGGAEYGVRGYITAYDALTGDQQWRFYTVPGDPAKKHESKAMEIASKTWSGDWWKYGGGGTAWDAMAFDPELNLFYVGTGNGSPWSWFHRSEGKGDNLFLSSILALNPDDGELVWYYQTTPGDDWDYTATQHLILADLDIAGEKRKVIMQAPKNGFFYVLDRADGKLISAEPYTYVNWASSIDKATGRPVESGFSRYKDHKENITIAPGPIGGHNWQPMAYNPLTRLVYISAHYNAYVYGYDSSWTFSKRGWNTAAEANPNYQTRKDEQTPGNLNQGKLIAWDPQNQKEVWSVNHPATFWNGGVLTSAGGLVFQGTAEGNFFAFDAENGNKLWETNLGSGIIGSPITYAIDGRQYVSIAVGWGGVIGLWTKFTKYNHPGTVYTFALDADEPYPRYHTEEEKKPVDLAFTATEKQIKDGGILYNKYCAQCHGRMGGKGGAIPNLAYSKAATFSIFEHIVLKGMFISKGMPNFSNTLSDQEVKNIKNYILFSAGNM